MMFLAYDGDWTLDQPALHELFESWPADPRAWPAVARLTRPLAPQARKVDPMAAVRAAAPLAAVRLGVHREADKTKRGARTVVHRGSRRVLAAPTRASAAEASPSADAEASDEVRRDETLEPRARSRVSFPRTLSAALPASSRV